jgi:hypothetical protein
MRLIGNCRTDDTSQPLYPKRLEFIMSKSQFSIAFFSVLVMYFVFMIPLYAQVPDSTIQAEIDKYTLSSGTGKKALPASPVNVNTASVSELVTLPGIRETTAKKLIAFRKTLKDARFLEKGQLIQVPGIGIKKLTKLWPYITTE